MCNSCLLVSNHHGNAFERKCHRCGGNNLIASYNFESDATDGIQENKERLEKLKREVAELQVEVDKAEAEYARLWYTDKDVLY